MTLERDIAYELQALETRIKTLEMRRRICVECKHHSIGDYHVHPGQWTAGMPHVMLAAHLCNANHNRITGEPRNACPCEWMRLKDAQCGLDGMLWEPKDAI